MTPDLTPEEIQYYLDHLTRQASDATEAAKRLLKAAADCRALRDHVRDTPAMYNAAVIGLLVEGVRARMKETAAP